MNKKSIGALIIGSAVIWAFVIIGCSYKLSGTECYNEISGILIGGVITHLVLIWGPLSIQFKKLNKEE